MKTITNAPDEIMTRFYELSTQSNIPDMHKYATDWQQLAMECDQWGRVATAETCRKNAQRYCEMAGGEYVRLVEDCFAELIPVELFAEEMSK